MSYIKSFQSKSWQRIAILFTVLTDALDNGIMLPILAELFYSSSIKFFPSDFPTIWIGLMSGILIAASALPTFFFVNFWGQLSDRLGRRKILLISLVGTVVARSLVMFGILTQGYLGFGIMLLGRFIDGVTGGNLSITTAAMIDLSTEKNKGRNMGLFNASMAIGVLLGPTLTAVTSNIQIFQNIQSYIIPFMISVIFALVNVVFVYLVFDVKLFQKLSNDKTPTFKESLGKLWITVNDKKYKYIILCSLIYTVGFYSISMLLSIFLRNLYGMTPSMISSMIIYIAFIVIFTQVFLVNIVSHRFKHITTIKYLLFANLVLNILLFAHRLPFIGLSLPILYILIGSLTLIFGLISPIFNVYISDITDQDKQGEIVGTIGSLAPLTWAGSSLIGGLLIGFLVDLPVIFAIICNIIAILFIIKIKK